MCYPSGSRLSLAINQSSKISLVLPGVVILFSIQQAIGAEHSILRNSVSGQHQELIYDYFPEPHSRSEVGDEIIDDNRSYSDRVAGGLPNLRINSVQLVDSNGNSWVPVVGKRFWVRVNFAYDNPACTPYSINRIVNGFTHTAPSINWGCGMTGTRYFWHYWGAWVMHKGGAYSVTVSLDADHNILESNEADNTVTMDFDFFGVVTAEWARVKVDEGRAQLGDGTDVIVGTMDDAFDFNHPWLSGNDSLGRPRLVASNQNTLGIDGSAINAVHATAVMGIVLARGNNNGDITGLAPDARYVTAEFLNRANIPGHSVLHVLDAAGFLVDHGAEVINMSWSWWFGNDLQTQRGETSTTNLMADYLTYGLNIVCVPAVNQLQNYTRPTAPGSSRNVITVGGLDDSLERAWSQQDYGPTLDGRSKPDLLGNDSANAVTLDPAWRNGFPAAEGWRGTSFSAPFVTGAVAQMLDYGKHHGESTDHRVIKAIIMNSGTKILDDDGSSWVNSETVPLDNQQGTGLLDLERVYAMYSASQQSSGVVDVPGYDFGNVQGVTGNEMDEGVVIYRFGTPVSTSIDLDITLVWDRHTFWNDTNLNGSIDAGDTFFVSASDMQDNLDLALYRNGVEISASRSLVDNVEHLHLSNVERGLYELHVQRWNVPSSGSEEDYAIAWHSDDLWAFPDADDDQDVDLYDYSVFQRCIDSVAVQCLELFDVDKDGKVSLLDYSSFSAVFTGLESLR